MKAALATDARVAPGAGPHFPASAFPHPPRGPLRRLFRNPEFGHELGTKSAEDNVARGRCGVVTAAIVGGGPFHSTSMIVRPTPPARSRTAPGTSVMGEPNNTNSPNTRGHTGMIGLRLTSIDMVVDVLSCCDCGRRGARRTWRSPPERTNRRVEFSPGAKRRVPRPASLR